MRSICVILVCTLASAVSGQSALSHALGKATPSSPSAELSQEEWEIVQQRLADLNYGVGSVDGVPGQRTRFAITNFQIANLLPATGRLDTATRAILMSAKAKPAPRKLGND